MLYVLACYGKSWLDKIIKCVEGQNTTHIAIQISDTIIAESSYCGLKLNTLSSKGGNFIRLKFKDMDSDTENKLIHCILDMVGKKPYDYKLFFGLGINRALSFFDNFGVRWRVNFDDPSKMICVEVIVEAYKQVTGNDLLPGIIDSEIVPHHILLSPYLEVVN